MEANSVFACYLNLNYDVIKNPSKGFVHAGSLIASLQMENIKPLLNASLSTQRVTSNSEWIHAILMTESGIKKEMETKSAYGISPTLKRRTSLTTKNLTRQNAFVTFSYLDCWSILFLDPWIPLLSVAIL